MPGDALSPQVRLPGMPDTGTGVAGAAARAAPPGAPPRSSPPPRQPRLPTAVIVGPAGGAVARRGARHRVNRPAPWDVQVAGDFLGASPAAIHLTDHEHIVAGAVVAAANRAVARRAARYCVNESAQARAGVEVSRNFLGGAPAAAHLADHECLQAAGGVAGVVPAGRAIARRGARHRADPGVPALVS